MTITKEKLLQCATQFEIDPYGQISITKRGNTAWTIDCGSMCLGKDATWHYHVLPSGRTDEFIANTRFESVEKAAEFYFEFIKNRYYIVAQSNGDHGRWYCVMDTTSEQDAKDSWANIKKNVGLWVFFGPNRAILDTWKGPNSDKVVFNPEA